MRNKLSCNAVDSTPQDIDWGKALGEDLEGYVVYEAVECPECGHEYVGVGVFPCCPECGTEYEGDTGPMMSYWYPVDIQDCEGAAEKIADFPLCIVEFSNGLTGLALTGGGVDLTWKICGAFVALGYLPPVHFCRLPRMSGWKRHPRSKGILQACLESAECAARWAESKAGECREMLALVQAVEAESD